MTVEYKFNSKLLKAYPPHFRTALLTEIARDGWPWDSACANLMRIADSSGPDGPATGVCAAVIDEGKNDRSFVVNSPRAGGESFSRSAPYMWQIINAKWGSDTWVTANQIIEADQLKSSEVAQTQPLCTHQWDWGAPEDELKTPFCNQCGIEAPAEVLKQLKQNQRRKEAIDFLESHVSTARRGRSMKKWVRLHKDGEHMGVETNCTDEREFWTELSDSLAKAIEGKYLGQAQEQFQRWLPQAFECLAQLRGYKANVIVEQVVKAGEIYSGTQEVFSSERPHLSVVSKEEAG